MNLEDSIGFDFPVQQNGSSDTTIPNLISAASGTRSGS